ncbi:MAG: OmpA family protein [Runella sp.]
MKNSLFLIALMLFWAVVSSEAQTRKRLPEPINLPDEIEYAPSISADGSTLIFQSGRYGIFVNAARKVPKINSEGNQMEILNQESTHFFGIYEAKRHRSGQWMPPTPIQSINRFDTGMTPVMGGPSISYDGNLLFFFANYTSRGIGYGREDIYYSIRQKEGWSEPINIGPEINTAGYEGFPSISSDGKRLYFVRENLTKKGETEQVCYSIMMSEKNREGKWKRPIELPAPVNMDCEKAPRIMADNRTLVYSSLKKGGKGDFDLFMSVFQDDGTWSTPKPLDFINTKRSDQHVAISACGDLMYYVSDGDIYTVPVPEELRPFKMATIQGYITDSLNGKPIATRIVVTESATNIPYAILESNASDGRFTVLVPTNGEYVLSVNEKDYRTKSIAIKKDLYINCEVIKRDFPLQSLKNGQIAKSDDIIILKDEPVVAQVEPTPTPPSSSKPKPPVEEEVIAESKVEGPTIEKLSAEQAAEKRLAQLTIEDSLKRQRDAALLAQNTSKPTEDTPNATNTAQNQEVVVNIPNQQNTGATPSQNKESETLNVVVLVRDAETDSLMANASVLITDLTKGHQYESFYSTIAKGRVVQIPPQSSISIKATAQGYTTAEAAVKDISSDKRLALKIRKIKPSILKITVSDLVSGALLPKANVTVSSKTTGEVEEMTLLTGRTELSYTKSDALKLTATADGYTSVSKDLVIEIAEAGKIYEFEAKIERISYALKASAIDLETSEKLSKANFRLVAKANNATTPLTTNPQTGIGTTPLPGPGQYELFCEVEGYTSKSQPLTIDKEQNEVVFKLSKLPKKTIALPVSIIDQYTGEAVGGQLNVAGAKIVQISPPLLNTTEGEKITISVKAEGYTAATQHWIASDTLTKPLVIRLAKGGYEFTFRTLNDKTRKPILDADFTVVTADTKQRVSAETTYDKTVVVLAPSKDYLLIVKAEGYQNYQALFKTQEALRNNALRKDLFLIPIESTPAQASTAATAPKVIESKTFGTIEKGKAIVLNNIYFDQSSPVLRPESFKELDELAHILQENASIRIEIRGHTDNVGDFDLNVKLSRDRCQSVVEYLNKKGINASRMQTVGRGPLDPVAPNNTEENRKKNRRVEFVVL